VRYSRPVRGSIRGAEAHLNAGPGTTTLLVWASLRKVRIVELIRVVVRHVTDVLIRCSVLFLRTVVRERIIARHPLVTVLPPRHVVPQNHPPLIKMQTRRREQAAASDYRQVVAFKTDISGTSSGTGNVASLEDNLYGMRFHATVSAGRANRATATVVLQQRSKSCATSASLASVAHSPSFCS
jgi:hypothetical protein